MKNRKSMEAMDQSLINLISFINDVMARDPERGVVKRADCPICGGIQSLKYGRSISIGHLRAKCRECGLNLME